MSGEPPPSQVPNIPPPSQPFPGSLTPGWNDPPPLHNTDTPKTRNKLNKRIAFPLQGTPSHVADVSKPMAVIGPNNPSYNDNPTSNPPLMTTPNPPLPIPPTTTLSMEDHQTPRHEAMSSQLNMDPSGMGNQIPTVFVPGVPRQTTTTGVTIDNENSNTAIQHL